MDWAGVRGCLVALVAVGAVGCSSESPEQPAPSAPPEAYEQAGGVRTPLTIHFDYRFDTRGFFDAKKKKVLEAAALVWTSRLKDRYPSTLAGAPVLLRHPETGELMPLVLEANEGIIVFAGSRMLPSPSAGISSPAGFSGLATEQNKPLLTRLSGDDFQPFAGSLAISTEFPLFVDDTPETTKATPAGQVDLLSVAVHELGHILGFGAAGRFERLAAGGAFDGPKVRALLGAPAPLNSDGGHLADGSDSCMTAYGRLDARCLPTALDFAVLADIGYEL